LVDVGREKSRPAMVGERNGMGKERGWACQESYDSVITLANDSSMLVVGRGLEVWRRANVTTLHPMIKTRACVGYTPTDLVFHFTDKSYVET